MSRKRNEILRPKVDNLKRKKQGDPDWIRKLLKNSEVDRDAKEKETKLCD